ncbi:MAG: glycosyltransferase family 9 protein [Actinomycetota bacterium]|nr:glycosyltransferase family 9 protein [Actinomycetota bacterium]
MGPAIRAVAAQAERVTLLCSARGRQAAQLLPGVDELIVYAAPWIDPEPDPVDRGEVLALVDRLAGLGADQAIILTSFHQSPLPLALLLRLAGVPMIGAISPDYPGSLLDVRHSVAEDVHEVERALSLVHALGYELPGSDDGALHIVRRPESRPDALGEDGYVVVHPGASVPARAWAPDRCAELVAELRARGRSVVVTGSATETELTAHVAGRSDRRVVDLGGRTDLASLAEVLAGADVLVAGNTGPAHLAAAVRTPVVSLFAPTVPPTRWRPWGTPHVLLGRHDIGCAGCRAKVCPYENHPCLDAVPVEQVLEAVETLAPSDRKELAACEI